MDFFQSLDRQIFDFVEAPENRRLRAGTGSYSTHFRGMLFGQKASVAVAAKIQAQRVDVLWLGANPSVPTSLERILDPHADDAHFNTFLAQMKSGMFSQHAVEPNADFIPWNPIQNPTKNWVIYNRILSNPAVADIDAVAMANIFPWGSKEMVDLAAGIRGLDRSLWHRVTEFANHINIQIVEALRPKLLIVPRSVGGADRPASKELRGMGLVESDAKELISGAVTIDGKQRKYSTGICVRGRIEVPVAYLPHPASLKITTLGRAQIVERFTEVLSATMGAGAT